MKPLLFVTLLSMSPSLFAICLGDPNGAKQILKDASLIEEVVFQGKTVNADSPLNHLAPSIEITLEDGKKRECTGVSFNARQVLTSAHCFPKGKKIDYVAVEYRDEKNRMTRLITSQVRVHPDYHSFAEPDNTDKAAPFDIAVIEFATDQALIPNARVWDRDKPPANVTVLGRGFYDYELRMVDSKEKDAESSQKNSTPPQKWESVGLLDLKLRQVRYILDVKQGPSALIPMDKGRMCNGDSGGPVVADSGEVYGLNSRYNESGDSNRPCDAATLSFATPVRPHLDFISGKLTGFRVPTVPKTDEAGNPVTEP